MLLEKPIQQFGEVESSNTTEFQLDVTPKIFEMLSGLYPNKIRAVIRELLCNAIDSHIDADQSSVPVDVYIPSDEYPYLTIRDYGVGMSHETVLDIYTRYSKSTKAHNPLTTGALGLGSKSPFCYTNLFTLKSVYEGEECTYNVYINSNRIPALTLLSKQPSDDSNGVTVTVPVKKQDYENFRRSLEFVLKHTISPVKVYNMVQVDGSDRSELGNYTGDGESGTEVVDVSSNFRRFSDLVTYAHSDIVNFIGNDPWGNSSTNVYVLQANVIYPIQDYSIVEPLFVAALKPNRPIVFTVPNGTVSFSPTREELSMDVTTIDNLTKIVNQLATKAKSWAKFYAMYMSRYTVGGKGRVLKADEDLPSVLRKPFWSFLYNYKNVKLNETNTYWEATKRLNKKTGIHQRFGIPVYKLNKNPYLATITNCYTHSAFPYVLKSKLKSENGQIEIETLLSNIYSYYNLDADDTKGLCAILNTYSNVIVADTIRDVWNIVKRLGCGVKLVELDPNEFLVPYKKPPTPRSPVRTFIMNVDTVHAKVVIEQQTVTDVTEFKYFLLRVNNSIQLPLSDSGDITSVSFDSYREIVYETNIISAALKMPVFTGNVLILTPTQYQKISKNHSMVNFNELLFGKEMIRKISMYAKAYYYQTERRYNDTIYHLSTQYSDDPVIVKAVKRIQLEVRFSNRMLSRNRVNNLPQSSPRNRVEKIGNQYSFFKKVGKIALFIDKYITKLNGVGLRYTQDKEDPKLVRCTVTNIFKEEYSNAGITDALTKYIGRVYWIAKYPEILSDDICTAVYKNYLRDLVDVTDEVSASYIKIEKILNRLTGRDTI